MINLNQLYYFYLTAKFGSVTKAAEVLKIAQPSLSSQLKVFEKSIHKHLFRKKGRKLELTPDGVAAYSYSKRIFEVVDEFQKYNKGSIASSGHRSRVGVAREVERPFIADVLSTILKKYSGTKANVKMSTGEHTELVDQLFAGELDVLVTNTPLYNEGINILSSIDIPVFPVVSPDYLKKRKLNSGADLQRVLKSSNLFLVLPTHKLKLRYETDVFLQKFGISDVGVFESDILAAVVRAVVEGVGIAFLPSMYVEKEIKQKKLIILGKNSSPSWAHKIYLTALENKQLDPIALEVQKYFEVFG